MVLKSYAKINLSLNVVKRFDNGLHDIQTMYCLIDLYDTIYIKKLVNTKYDKISFSGKYSNQIKVKNNSIQKILNIMRKNRLIKNFYSIKVIKRIPVFSGLGGGSSNAVTIFKHLLKKKIKKKIFNQTLNSVGSDLKLFFYNQGFLKDLYTVIKLKKKYKLFFLLAHPKIKCSTPMVYKEVKKFSKKRAFVLKEFHQRVGFINFLITGRNDLQSIVEKKYSLVRKLLSDIYIEKGCYLSRMTGSGSVCFGLFSDENCSKVALRALKKKYPKFWFSIAKTI